MRINNFSISLMRREGMSIADISAKTGIEPEEITRRLKAYEGHDTCHGKDECISSDTRRAQ